MSNLAFLYRSELPHRAVTVYIYAHLDAQSKRGSASVIENALAITA